MQKQLSKDTKRTTLGTKAVREEKQRITGQNESQAPSENPSATT